jgi:hypothetical protein
MKFTHCSVKVSRLLAASPPPDWTRESAGDIPHSGGRGALQSSGGHRPQCRARVGPQSGGRPRSNADGGIGILTKKIAIGATLALLRGEPFLRIDPQLVSPAFFSVVQFLSNEGVEEHVTATPYKRFYVRYLCSILKPRKHPSEGYNQSTFERKIGGFLKFWVKPRWQIDHLHAFNHEGVQMSIVSGCWVHPSAPSILQNASNNRITCLMADTTWAVMSDYVTAILVGISHNTAIPLAISFGPIEDSNIYEIFFNIFYGQFGVDLSRFTLESDQGSGLAKFARLHAILQRFCLRHFLASLKDHVFAVFVHFLVKVKTQPEFLLMIEYYRLPVHQSIESVNHSRTGDGLKRAQREFAKAGLLVVYVDGETLPVIQIADQVRWDQVSSISKMNEAIPMTTNSIEAINGHCNESTPRRNSFWGSLTRLAKMVNRGIDCFPLSVKHNFNAATRRTAAFVRIIGQHEINRQKVFYRTNPQNATCDCGVSSYFSRLFNQFIPCCHLMHAGLKKPVLVNPPSLVRSVESYFVLVLESAERDGEEPSRERRDTLIDLTAHAIKNLSKTGVKFEDVLVWATSNWQTDDHIDKFVCNLPVSTLMLISAGVLHFACPGASGDESEH